MVTAGTRPDGITYPDSLNLLPFLNDPGPLLVDLMILTYVPNYFDIMPMYMVVLALVPVMLFAERRAHYVRGGSGEIGMTIDAVVDHQMTGEHFAIHALAARPGAGDGFGRLLT